MTFDARVETCHGEVRVYHAEIDEEGRLTAIGDHSKNQWYVCMQDWPAGTVFEAGRIRSFRGNIRNSFPTVGVRPGDTVEVLIGGHWRNAGTVRGYASPSTSPE